MVYLQCIDCRIAIGTSRLSIPSRCPRCGGILSRRPHQRGWKASNAPTSSIDPPISTKAVDDPARKSVSTPIITSGKPALSEGPADQGELFSGK
jgi:hypothetical protein